MFFSLQPILVSCSCNFFSIRLIFSSVDDLHPSTYWSITRCPSCHNNLGNRLGSNTKLVQENSQRKKFTRKKRKRRSSSGSSISSKKRPKHMPYYAKDKREREREEKTITKITFTSSWTEYIVHVGAGMLGNGTIQGLTKSLAAQNGQFFRFSSK